MAEKKAADTQTEAAVQDAEKQPEPKKQASGRKKAVKLIKVRVKTGLMYNEKRYTTGDVLEMPEPVAKGLIERHFVEPVEEEG